jgi:hypothetical protein
VDLESVWTNRSIKKASAGQHHQGVKDGIWIRHARLHIAACLPTCQQIEIDVSELLVGDSLRVSEVTPAASRS